MPGGRIEPAARVTGPQPLAWLAWLCAAATITYVVGAPFWAADYPMMTEFPFHAASSSVFRHYTDPGWPFTPYFYLARQKDGSFGRSSSGKQRRSASLSCD